MLRRRISINCNLKMRIPIRVALEIYANSSNIISYETDLIDVGPGPGYLEKNEQNPSHNDNISISG
jgi:hypothetical protein